MFVSELSLVTANGAVFRYSQNPEPRDLTSWHSQSQNPHSIQGLLRTPRIFPSTRGHHVQVGNFCLRTHQRDQSSEEQLASPLLSSSVEILQEISAPG